MGRLSWDFGIRTCTLKVPLLLEAMQLYLKNARSETYCSSLGNLEMKLICKLDSNINILKDSIKFVLCGRQEKFTQENTVCERNLSRAQDSLCAQWRLSSASASAHADQSSLPVWRRFGSLAILRRLWSDCVDAQADLSLRWAHMQSCRKCCVPAQSSKYWDILTP